jgi:hypothetical protein
MTNGTTGTGGANVTTAATTAGAGGDGSTVASTSTTSGGACQPAWPMGGVLATFQSDGETLDVSITNPADINLAIQLWQGLSGLYIPVGNVVCSPAPWDCAWGFHMDPASVTFTDQVDASCDGDPDDVMTDCNSYKTFCNSGAVMTQLRDCRTNPNCPSMPKGGE